MKGEVVNKLTADGYVIPAPLVHRVLWAIVVAIVTVGAYMVAWGFNDAAFKSRVLTELSYLKERVVEIGEDQDRHELKAHGI